MDIHVIQEILGHAQVTTMRIYTDPTAPLTREAADSIGGLLWPEADHDQDTDPAPGDANRTDKSGRRRRTATKTATKGGRRGRRNR